MANRRNKRGIKVKRCCASCSNKEIDDEGVRHCTLGYENCETCRHWHMREELRRCGRPDGVIKDKAYLRYVLDIRDSEINGSCFQYRGELRDIEDIRKEFLDRHSNIITKF